MSRQHSELIARSAALPSGEMAGRHRTESVSATPSEKATSKERTP
jgi:hypothetical protein